jgi:hypothetical protein
MLITPDLSEVSTPISAGTYKVRIVKAVPGEYKTGLKYINWHMETFESEDAKDDGRYIFNKTPYTGKAAFRMADMWRAALGKELEGKFDTEQLLGKEIKVVVVDGTDQEGNPSGYPDVKTVASL